MTRISPRGRWSGRLGLAAASAFVTAIGLIGMASPAAAQPAGASPNPYAPNYQHSYRHGAVPTRQALQNMRSYAATHPGAVVPNAVNDLNYGGGVDGIGVTTGSPKVYVVFWGTQWGTQSTNGSGDLTFSNDTAGASVRIQDLFKGVGVNSELWSGVMTQFCEGVAAGTQQCGNNGTHVGYPTGGAFAGVWYDNSAAEPSAASPLQIGNEAVKAASHFGNTTAASNRSAQYDIVSAKGLNPDNYKTGGFCAWHDWNGDVGASSSVGDIAFTNMPYILDVGTSCGENFVNSGTAGTLDGFSIVNGHEYAETITDQNPAGGWTDSSGEENADKCAWISSGQGASANVSFSTGSFAMQSTWSNDTNGGNGECDMTHTIFGGGGGNPTVTNPGSQTGTVGTAVSLTMHATGGTAPYTWSATGLPAGLSINSSSGVISGTPTTANTYSVSVTATDSASHSGSASFTWTINPAGAGNPTVNNPGSQTGTVGTAVSLTVTASGGTPPYTWSATGLPAGLSISSSGVISGTPTTANTYSVTVTATDSASHSGSASFTWTINPAGGGCASPGQKVANSSFESGSASWSATAGVIGQNGPFEPAHTGTWDAWMDGYGTTHTDTVSQNVALPAGCTTYTYKFFLHIDTSETTTVTAYDTLRVQVIHSGTTTTLATYSNLNHASGYVSHSFNLAAYAGQTVTLKFIGAEDISLQTSFVLDDITVNVS